MTKPRKELRTETVIHASASRIWEILMDFDRYPNWNSFIISINGNQVAGSTLTVKLQLPGGMGMTMRPKVLVVKDYKEFRWKGQLLVPGFEAMNTQLKDKAEKIA